MASAIHRHGASTRPLGSSVRAVVAGGTRRGLYQSGARRELVSPCRVLIVEGETVIDTPTGPMRTSIFKPASAKETFRYPYQGSMGKAA